MTPQPESSWYAVHTRSRHERKVCGEFVRQSFEAYLPENPPLYPEMTVAAYVDYVARIKDVPRRERAAAVDRALERCGLRDVASRVIGTLSKGYKQRVGLAQAIVHEPPVLVGIPVEEVPDVEAADADTVQVFVGREPGPQQVFLGDTR